MEPKRSWPRRLLRYGLELLLVVGVLLGVEAWQTREVVRGVPVTLEAVTVDGTPFNLAQWRGRKGILYFWAEWCPVCQANRHVASALAQDYPLMTIAMQSGSTAEVAAYLQQEGITFPVIADETGEISRRLHVQGVPLALIIDSEGRISHVARGYTTELGLRVRLWLAS